MRRDLPKFLLLALVAPLALGGCLRFKSWESFRSTTEPYHYQATWNHQRPDPYTYGGVSDATGGLQPRVNYGSGARQGTTERIDPYYNRPAKGSGLHPGEATVQADTGYGNSNAPSLQGEPGASQNPSVRSAR